AGKQVRESREVRLVAACAGEPVDQEQRTARSSRTVEIGAESGELPGQGDVLPESRLPQGGEPRFSGRRCEREREAQGRPEAKRQRHRGHEGEGNGDEGSAS